MVNCFLTYWAKKSPRFVDEKIFIFENVTQMYPRGQSHLERAPTHLLGYWCVPTASSLERGTKPWENGVGIMGGAFWFLGAEKSGKKVACDSPVCRKKKNKPNQQKYIKKKNKNQYFAKSSL